MTWRVEYKSDRGKNIAVEEVADEAAADAKIVSAINPQTAYVQVGKKHIRRESVAVIEKSEVTPPAE